MAKSKNIKTFTYAKAPYKRGGGSKALIAARRAAGQPGLRGRFSGADAPELKFFDTDVNFTVDATPEVPATGQLCLIPQGVTESTRVGRKCCIKSIQINGLLQQTPAAATSSASLISIVMVQDTQANGAAAAPADVYDIGGTVLPVSVRNIENSSRFKILKRWDVVLSSSAGVSAAYNNVLRKWDFYTKCTIPLEFSSTTGAIGELKTNNVFLLAGSNGVAADDTVTVLAKCRLRYSDM